MISQQTLKGNLLLQDYTTAFTLNQGDKGVPFRVELLENGTPYILQSTDIVTIEWLKPNGNPFLQEGDIKYGTNYIEFTTPEAIAQCNGSGSFNIIISNGDLRKGTIRREYKVIPTSFKPGSISEDVITDAITELRSLSAEIASTVQNNQELIDNNQAATKQDIANVNSSLEEITKRNKNVKYISEYEKQGAESDDSGRLQRAFDESEIVIINEPLIVTGINTSGAIKSVFGYGETSQIKHRDNATSYMLTIDKEHLQFFSINFKGSDEDNNVKDIGVMLVGNRATPGKHAHHFTMCSFSKFKSVGFYFADIYNPNSSVMFTSCKFYENAEAVHSDVYGEYATFTCCHFYRNKIALTIKGGNNSFIGCTINLNTEKAISMTSGTNDGHGMFVGCSINHNTGSGIDIKGIKCGEIFESCNIFDTPIVLRDLTSHIVGYSIGFSNCRIQPSKMIFDNATVSFKNNEFGFSNLRDEGIMINTSLIENLGNTIITPDYDTKYNNLKGGYFRSKFDNELVVEEGDFINIVMNENSMPWVQNLESHIYNIDNGEIVKFTNCKEEVEMHINMKISMVDDASVTTTSGVVVPTLCISYPNKNTTYYFPATQFSSSIYMICADFKTFMNKDDKLKMTMFCPNGKKIIIQKYSVIEGKNF